MFGTRRQLRGLVPLLGSGLAVLFLVAQTLCALHCQGATAGGRAEQPSSGCHGSACHRPAADPADSAPSHTTATCQVLQSLQAPADGVSLTPPLAVNLTALAAEFDSLAAAVDVGAAIEPRHARPPNCLVSPVVCLGPALRSLAPPSLI